MKSMFADVIDKVVEEVLCSNKDAIIKIDGAEQPSAIAGCWTKDKNGNNLIEIYLYVCGKAIFKFQDVGTVITV